MRRSLFGLCLVALGALVVSGAMAAPPTTTPDMTASPSRVNFGRVLVGDVASQAVSFTNNTGETVTLSAGYGADDPFSRVYVALTLTDGQSGSVTLTFNPVSTGRFKSTIWVYFTGASNAQYAPSVAVSGSAYLPKGAF